MKSEMKLSEAIRLGAMVTWPTTGCFIEPYRRDGMQGACALGAAAIAVGMTVQDLALSRFEERFPILNTSTGLAEGSVFSTVYSAIVALNDLAMATREDIADVVERIELQQAQEALLEDAKAAHQEAQQFALAAKSLP